MGGLYVNFKMAATAARSLQRFARSPAFISKSTLMTIRKTAAAKGVPSASVGLLLGRNENISTRAIVLAPRRTFACKFSPTIVSCCIPKVSPLAVECAGESSECADGNLGEDDGDTWSLDDDEYYLKGS